MSRKNRVHLDQPLALTQEASRLAAEHGHPLTTYLTAALVLAAQAAEAGRGDLLPYQPPRRAVAAEQVEPVQMTKVAPTVSKEVAARWSAALERNGSSLTAVTHAALEAFVAAGGSWMDAVMPGTPGWRQDPPKAA